MKKSLLVLAILSATTTVMAADISLYGRADMGLIYTSEKMHKNMLKKGEVTDMKTHRFALESGNQSASRFGLTGSEDLGDGLKVGFLLENGFKADTGALGNSTRIFDREASLFVKTDFGTFRAGRMATMLSGAGSMGFYAPAANPFGTGWGTNISSHAGLFANQAGIMDNVLGYISPTVSGLTIYTQYAMGEQGAENTAAANRYAAVGAKYNTGPLEVVSAIDWTNKKSVGTFVHPETKVESSLNGAKDAYTLNLAGSYDLGFAKTYIATQYFKNVNDVAGMTTKNKLNSNLNQGDGWGLAVGAKAPVLGGNLLVSAGYMDAEMYVDNDTRDISAYALSAGYTYSLSKRTNLYTGLGYVYKDGESKVVEYNTKTFEATAGLLHTF